MRIIDLFSKGAEKATDVAEKLVLAEPKKKEEGKGKQKGEEKGYKTP